LNQFEKHVIKLKIFGTITITLITFIGIIFLETFDYGNEFAKQTTEYSIKCLKETNPEVKKKYQTYLSYIKNTIEDIKIVPIFIISVFLLLLIISIAFSIYYLFKVMRL